MKVNYKKTAIVLAVLGTTTIGGSVFAASQYSNPAEMTAGVTNQSVESVLEQKKNENKTFRQIAEEAGKSEEYKAEKLQMKKDKLDKLVEEGKLTQEEADERLEKAEKNQERCERKKEKSKNKIKEGTTKEVN